MDKKMCTKKKNKYSIVGYLDDNDFLDSVVNENNAEYTILYSLNTSCVDKSFLFLSISVSLSISVKYILPQ